MKGVDAGLAPAFMASTGPMPRTRLIDSLMEARHRRCLWIHGPAGSGKSTLAWQWRARLLEFGFECAWVKTVPGMDAKGLQRAILGALAPLAPAVAQATRAAAEGCTQAWELSAPLLRTLQQQGGQLVLLFEDQHHLVEPVALALQQLLLELAPARLHVAFLSRQPPGTALDRWRDRADLLTLGFPDLAFTASETAACLRPLRPDLDSRRLQQLHDDSGGWPLAVHIACLALDTDGSPTRDPARLAHADKLSAGLRDAVLAGLCDEELAALAALATAGRFDDALARRIFGRADTPAPLTGLRALALVHEDRRAGSHQGTWQFHPVLQSMLVTQFAAQTPARWHAVHAVLATWFGGAGQLKEAVQHAVACGAPDQALRWIEQWGPDLLSRGELRPLAAAVAELEPCQAEWTPRLGLWSAWSQLCYRQLDDCAASIRLLRASPAAAVDAQELLLLEGSLALQRDDSEHLNALAAGFEAATASTARFAGGRRNLLGWMAIRGGRFDEAIGRLADPTLTGADGTVLHGSAFGMAMATALRGYAWLQQGDVRQAEQVLRLGLAQAAVSIGSDSEPACNMAAFLAAVLYDIDAVDAALSLLDGRTEAIERACLPDAWLCATRVRVRALHLRGATDEALRELDRFEAIAGERELGRLSAHAASLRLALRQHDTTAAALRHDLAGLEALAHSASGIDTQREIAALHTLAAVRRAVQDGDLPGAAHRLATWQNDPAAHVDAALRLAGLAEWARIDIHLGRTGPGRARLAQVLQLALEQGHVRALLDLGDDWLDLLKTTLCDGALPEPLALYAEHLLARAPRQRLANGTAPGDGLLRARELDVVRALSRAMPNKRIAQAFGLSQETVKWHLKNVYLKLGVHGREAAVARARDLGLVPD